MSINIYSFWNMGASYAPKPPKHAPAIVKAAEKARKQWLDALMVDQTRTWMSLGEKQPEILSAVCVILTIAGMAHVYDCKKDDTPELRIIRGAISTATQCSAEGSTLTLETAQAFRPACDRASEIIKAASIEAILHAATSIRKIVGSE